MKVCLDVDYRNKSAVAAALVFADWEDATATAQYTTSVAAAAEYQPGEFYRRELAPLQAVLQKVQEPIDTCIIDGYCLLSAEGLPGLGAHLHEALGRGHSVVGVAKNRYRDTRHAEEVFRGGSQRPLFVTAVAMAPERAAACVRSMSGPHRIPKLLKAVDTLCRRPLNAS